MNLLERFLKYIKIDTTSDEKNNCIPSTKGQLLFAKELVKELKEMNIDEVIFDEEHCYVYAKIYGNDKLPKIGFVSHLDTSNGALGKNISPKIIKNYDGSDILLNDEIKLGPSDYPDLKNHIGKTLITTDGKTLLGADDKAGIAEIMCMLEYYIKNKKNIGDIIVCFTPDEEIGQSTLYLDYNIFDPDIAYTVDGSAVGEFSYENFNAASASIIIKGKNTHCGYAKDKMINAVRIATVINSLLPVEIPENTEGYEGFYHLEELSGDVNEAKMQYLIRDFDQENFEFRKTVLQDIVDRLNIIYDNSIILTIKDTYQNMYEGLKNKKYIIDNTITAIKKTKINPDIVCIRGGTDGAKITFDGIPCPNLGTGGHNFHSIYEYICLEDMEKALEILLSIVDNINYEKFKSIKILKK